MWTFWSKKHRMAYAIHHPVSTEHVTVQQIAQTSEEVRPELAHPVSEFVASVTWTSLVSVYRVPGFGDHLILVWMSLGVNSIKHFLYHLFIFFRFFTFNLESCIVNTFNHMLQTLKLESENWKNEKYRKYNVLMWLVTMWQISFPWWWKIAVH